MFRSEKGFLSLGKAAAKSFWYSGTIARRTNRYVSDGFPVVLLERKPQVEPYADILARGHVPLD
jgi:hypothetical protein